jgi:hypothetical protein
MGFFHQPGAILGCPVTPFARLFAFRFRAVMHH